MELGRIFNLVGIILLILIFIPFFNYTLDTLKIFFFFPIPILGLIGYVKGDKKLALSLIIIWIVVVVITIWYLANSFPVPRQHIFQEMALDKACKEFINLDCDISKLNQVRVEHQEPGSAQRDYTLEELCTLRSIETSGFHTSGDMNECAQRCGCPLK